MSCLERTLSALRRRICIDTSVDSAYGELNRKRKNILDNSSNAGGVLILEEEEQWRGDVDGNHNKTKVAGEIQRDDFVFGTNSVGSEAANLY